MGVLWCGGEDSSFPNGAAMTVSTNSAQYGPYARCSVYPAANGTTMKGLPFPGGAVTSLWVSFYAYSIWWSNQRSVGICRSGTEKGIFLGGSGSATKLGLFTWDGSNLALLQAETGNTLTTALARIDIQIVNFGGSSNINVWYNGQLLIQFSGSSAISGISDLDSIYSFKSANNVAYVSSIIVDTADTRMKECQTLALTGDGAKQWTGAYSTINQTAISDAGPNYVNTTGQHQQFDVTDLMVATSWTIEAVRVEARMAKSAASTPTKVALGYKNGAGVAKGVAGDLALTTGYTSYETLDLTDPTKTAAWAAADISGLQFDLLSVA